MQKQCNVCQSNKPLTAFNARQGKCKDCQRAYNQRKYQEHRSAASGSDSRVHEWLQDQANEKVLEELTKVNDRLDCVLDSVQSLSKKLDSKKSRHHYLIWAVVAIAFTGWNVR